MSGYVTLLLGLAVFVFGWQWCWARAASSVAPHRIPPHARRRVQWLVAHTARIQLTAGFLALAAVAVALLG